VPDDAPTEPHSLLAELSLEPDWVERLRDEPFERATALLAEADDLREGDHEQQHLAMSCYQGLQDRIDVETARGTAQVRWLLRSLDDLPAAFEPLMRRTALKAGDRSVREEADVAVGICLANGGDPGRAEGHLRACLAGVRDTGRPAEFAACMKLHAVFHRQRRVFESLVVARRAVLLAERAAHPYELAEALLRVAYGLISLEAWEALEEIVRQAEELLPQIAANRRQETALELSSVKANRDMQRGLPEQALRELEHVETVVRATGAFPTTERWLLALRGDVLLRAGEFEAARRKIEDALEEWRTQGPGAYYRLRLMAAQCEQGLGDTESAAELAAAIVAELTSGEGADLGSGMLLKIAADSGLVLQECGGLDDARSAWELAAHAAIQRVIELDQCTRYLADLSLDVEADRALFARVRPRFIETHEQTLARVATVFEKAIEAGEPWIEGLLADGEYFRICAWCHRFQSRDGTWVPGGQYLSASDTGRLSHGMCADCLADLRRTHPAFRDV